MGFIEWMAALEYRPGTVDHYVTAVRHFWITATGSDPSFGRKRPGLLIRDYRARCTLEPLFRRAFEAHWLHHGLRYSDPVVPLALYIGFVFFLRVSEYCTTESTGCRLSVRHLNLLPDGDLAIEIPVSKTDTVHRGSSHRRKPVEGALDHRLLYAAYAATRPNNAPDAPALQWRDGRPLTDADINRIIKEIVSAAGQDPQFYSSHSLRSGGATAAAAAGFPDSWIMREGRWEALESLSTYLRASAQCFADMTAKLLFGPQMATVPAGLRAPKPRAGKAIAAARA